jgi:hypothetical protein
VLFEEAPQDDGVNHVLAEIVHVSQALMRRMQDRLRLIVDLDASHCSAEFAKM